MYYKDEEYETLEFKNEKFRQILDAIREFDSKDDLWECLNVLEDIEELVVEGLNLWESCDGNSLF